MYQKKEQGAEEEKQKPQRREGPPRRRGPPPPRRQKEHIEVTPDTIVPEMPQKHEILPKPNWDTTYKPDYEKLLDDLSKLKDQRVLK